MKDQFRTNASSISFIDGLRTALKNCTSFSFAVSFVKISGLSLILREIREALARGATGRMLTSAYMNFTDIPSLKELQKLKTEYPRFDARFDFDCFDGFHAKGYLFRFPSGVSLTIGSSNLTRYALEKNVEWDLSLEESASFPSFLEASKDFDVLWSKTLPLTDELIDRYSKRLETAPFRWDMDLVSRYDPSALRPNFMQQEALREIARYRDMGEKKALIVAATGSGKTYLAAFDARNFQAKRLLYVVHQENILRASEKSFELIFRNSRTYGLFTGTEQDRDKDFLFATNQELSRHLTEFRKDEFDYIVLDECHHAVASSYRRILDYFQPEFLLGLTATANRMDNQDVLSLFDRNIPFQLSLADAMRNDLIVGFHYFAIKDPYVDYSLDTSDPGSVRQMVRQIVDPNNVRFVVEEVQKHRPEGKLRALAFCRTVDHAMQMAQGFNDLGLHATYLSGNDDAGTRQEAMEELSDEDNPLEVVCTINLFNEGIDIPPVNMVLFLRPTDSQTVFCQQLGRGLRKYPGKDYLTVLDFIGNRYQRSAQIALALSSFQPQGYSIEKTALRTMVETEFRGLDLPIEIHLDPASMAEILDSIDRMNFNRADYLKSDYEKFKAFLKTDRYPSHMDYLRCPDSPNLMRFIQARIGGRKSGSYYGFLERIGETTLPHFTEEEKALLTELSDLLPLVRPDDYSILLSLLSGDKDERTLREEDASYGVFKEKQFAHALSYLSGMFSSRLKPWFLTERGGRWLFPASSFSPEFLDHLKDLLTYGLTRFEQEFGRFSSTFLPYHTYSTQQILMLLGRKDFAQYLRGTVYQGTEGTLLVGLKKDSSLEERLNYKDKFLSPTLFQWESENGCTMTNGKGESVRRMKRVHLFVRKVKSEDGITLPYVYVGDGTMTKPRPSSNPSQSLLFDVRLDHPVEERYRQDLLVPEERKEA